MMEKKTGGANEAAVAVIAPTDPKEFDYWMAYRKLIQSRMFLHCKLFKSLKRVYPHIMDMVIIEVATGTEDKEIIDLLTAEYPFLAPADVADMIVSVKKSRVKRTMANYHALDQPSMGIDYSKGSGSGGVPADVPQDLVSKIAIDQAMENLKKSNETLWGILNLKYIEDISDIEIADFLGVSERTVFYWLDEAIERLTNLIEYGVSTTLRVERINQVMQRVEQYNDLIGTTQDRIWAKKIINEIYAELDGTGEMNLTGINEIDQKD